MAMQPVFRLGGQFLPSLCARPARRSDAAIRESSSRLFYAASTLPIVGIAISTPADCRANYVTA
jgi:hypothetical protein